MRSTINISLPEKLKEELDEQVEKGNFSSRSELVRAAVRYWRENEIVKRIYESKKQVEQGRAKKLDSVEDLN